MKMTQAVLDGALQDLGEILAYRALSYDLAAIGGGSLLLLGLMDRPTKDLDIAALIEGDNRWIGASPLPTQLLEVIRDVGTARNLAPDWLNSGPASLINPHLPNNGLPEGFAERTHVRIYGGLTLRLASRLDQIAFKLHALTDRPWVEKHATDLKKLSPTPDELLSAARWCRTQDISDAFRDELLKRLIDFGVHRDDV